MSLHNRIREARNAANMTQTDLANAVGVAKTTVSGWEKNREPNAAQIGAIADALKTNVSFLLQDEVASNNERQLTKNGGLSAEERAFFTELRKVPDAQRSFALDLCKAIVLELLKHQKVELGIEVAAPAVLDR